MQENSFGAKDTLEVGERRYEIFRLGSLQQRFDVARLPFSLKVLLENLLRTEGNGSVEAADVEALASWDAKAQPSKEIAFTPARVLMQDFTGVPAVVDLAAMRDAMAQMGGDPARINPLAPAELVIDHSVQVDAFGTRERRTRVRTKPRALRLPALGAGRIRRLRGRSAGHGDRASGQPRLPGARRLRRPEDRPGLPRHARRDGLAHDDDQRPGSARLGRGRHRGRGVDARPADVDAHPAGPRRGTPR